MSYETESWELKAEGLVRQMESMDKAYKKEIAALKEALRVLNDAMGDVEQERDRYRGLCQKILIAAGSIEPNDWIECVIEIEEALKQE